MENIVIYGNMGAIRTSHQCLHNMYDDSEGIYHYYTNKIINKYNIKLKKIIYKLEQQLGSGSFGIVYRGTSNYSKKLMAIKKIKTDSVSENEALIYSRLSSIKNYCKYVPKLYHIYKLKEYYYVTMEYFAGYHFTNIFFKKYAYNLKKSVICIKKLLLAINYFHKNGLILNDLKPENIIINSKGRLRIVDFGLVTMSDDNEHYRKGTPLYLPPESYDDIPSYNKKDVWSFGAIVYEFYTGKCLFSQLIYEKNDTLGFDTNLFYSYKSICRKYFIDTLKMNFDNDKLIIEIWDMISLCLTLDYTKRKNINEILKEKLFR